MEIRILGPLEVRDGERVIELGGGKQRALLADLVIHRGHPVPPDRLIDDLWGDRQPASAPKTLQALISRLRRSLGSGTIVMRAGGYLLAEEHTATDVDRLETLLQKVREASVAGEKSAAGEAATAAVELFRGPPLTDFRYDEFAQAEIARLGELHLHAVEEKFEHELRAGHHGDLIPELEALVRAHPLRERLRAQQMLALYRSGRQAEALDAYQVARKTLVNELGIEPSRELRHLEQAMLQQDPTLDLIHGPSEDVPPAPSERFVGRERELEALEAGLDDAFRGRGRLFLVVGEPGIGKSRLAEELSRRARAQGAVVVVGRCWEAGGAPAYWPWMQSLRAYVRDADRDTLRTQVGGAASELAHIIPELREFEAERAVPSSPEGEGARFRLFDATTEFIRRASSHRPLVVVLDDLHAADTASLLLLQFVAREIASAHVLILALFRDVDPLPAQPVLEILAELTREPVTRRLSLRGLSRSDVAAYLESSASGIASPDFIVALHEETDGNPLFVGEMVRLVSLEHGAANASPHARVTIPQSVREVIARRLRHLSEHCNSVLVIASVLGRDFSLEVLTRLSPLAEDELHESLDEAMMNRIIVEIPGATGQLGFAHALIRDALYEDLTTVRRVRLHRQAVEALETVYATDRGPHLAEFAHHAVAGSAFEKAVTFAEQAGDRALELLAYEEAAALYETALGALALTSPSDEATRCRLLLSLGESEMRAGNVAAAKGAFTDAADLARRHGYRHELAHAAAGYGGRIVWSRAGADHRLVPLLEEALDRLGEADGHLRARLLARLAGALRDEHTRSRREALSGEAVDLARRAGDAALLAYTLDARVHAVIAPDTAERCLPLASELCDAAARSGDRERVVGGHVLRAMAQLLVGDVSGAEKDLAAANSVADELRQPAQLWLVLSTQSLVALAAGRLNAGEQLLRESFVYGERAQPDAATPVYRLQRYMLCDFRGHLEEVEPEIRALISDYPARPAFRAALAHAHARLGRSAEAASTLRDLAADNCSGLPFDQEWLWSMSLLAETASVVRDDDVASTLYRLLVPWEGLNAVDVGEGFRGAVGRYLGMLAMTMERWDSAANHFEHALTMNARMGSRPWLAHTQQDYAGLLVTRNDAGDRERAQRLLAEADAAYRDMGMASYVTATTSRTLEADTAAGH